MVKQTSKKYFPVIGDEIEFYDKKSKETGTVIFVGAKFVSVYPHTIKVTGFDKQLMDLEWAVELSEIIGEVTDVQS